MGNELSIQYYRVPLPALGVDLPAVKDGEGVYFPLATACVALEMDVRAQRPRVRREFGEHLAHYRLATAGGPQEVLCVEYGALGLWLATIQSGKASPRIRERLRLFRQAVMRAASAILMGQLAPIEGPAPALPGSAEMRLAQLERAVFVGDESDTAGAETVRGQCPHCGGSIQIDSASLRFIRADGE